VKNRKENKGDDYFMISCSGKRSIFDASDYAYRLRNLKEKSKGKSRKK